MGHKSFNNELIEPMPEHSLAPEAQVCLGALGTADTHQVNLSKQLSEALIDQQRTHAHTHVPSPWRMPAISTAM